MSHLKTNRPGLEDLVKRRFFYLPSFGIYGGVSGLYDFGPPGCSMKLNIESIWRKYFVLGEGAFEINATCMTPESCLKTSGHVDKFTDLMVRNTVNTSEFYRADKLLEEKAADLLNNNLKNKQIKNLQITEADRPWLERIVHGGAADAMSPEELDEALSRIGMKSLLNLTEPFEFNLMFQTSIGPAGNSVGYLRPETAQGMFMNFHRLLEQNGGKMPMGVAQLGLGFRNEIAPRAGLLRVREFPMAELEYFIHPEKKNHPRFHLIADFELPLLSATSQLAGETSPSLTKMEKAVSSRTIDNETVAHFLVKTFKFLVEIGVSAEFIRFRQHLPTEMAHYASDCWDCEIYTSYGWIECVGIADRSCYDLSVHAKATKTDLRASERLDVPVEEEVITIKLNKGKIGPKYGKNSRFLFEAIDEFSIEEKKAFKNQIENGQNVEVSVTCASLTFTVSPDMVQSIKSHTQMVSERPYCPSVIEPAFGIGRILYAVLEHSFRRREQETTESTVQGGSVERSYLSLPVTISPVKCSILPISSGNSDIEKIQHEIEETLGHKYNISVKVDDSGTSIGKRYARTDEIGIPFAITIDFDSISDNSVTIRERDSMEQIRVNIEECVSLVIPQLVNGFTTWDEMKVKYD